MKITRMKINGILNPIGYDLPYVSCSWNVEETKSKAYKLVRVEVAKDETFKQIAYRLEDMNLAQAGTVLHIDLEAKTRYYWRVFALGDGGDEAWSEPAFFETGKMKDSWQGKWIGGPAGDTIHPILSRSFQVTQNIEKSRLYMTGVGLFEVYMDGEKIGDEYLTPYLSNYEMEVQVMTFDLGRMKKGIHQMEIHLAPGWYMGTFGLELEKNNYGNQMAAIAELDMYDDTGEIQTLVTDQEWTYRASDVEMSGIYAGESLNRCLWIDRENLERPVKVIEGPEKNQGTKNLSKEHLVDRHSLPIRVKERVKPIGLLKTPKGETVLDMGQNFAGFVTFESSLPKGSRITLEFGEILQEGNFYNKNYRDAESTFTYVSDGRIEKVRTHFTYFGFRYVRIKGWQGKLAKEMFTGCVLYSDLERCGWITTGNDKINRLYANTLWGQKSNFMDIPTDCPQRSERLGWTGDIQVFAPTASFHMDTRAFLDKFLHMLSQEQAVLGGGIPNFIPNLGHKDDVGSVWGDAATFIPDLLYRVYADLEMAKKYYPMMKAWVDFIDAKDGLGGKRTYLYDFGSTFGDWLALDGATPNSFKGSTDDTYISSVYYYASTMKVAKMAENLGMDDHVEIYGQRAKKIRQAILDEFFTPTGRLAIDTQAAYVIALKFGVFIDRDKLIKHFLERLKKDCFEIKCGFVGAPLLCTVLGEVGLYERAYDFIFKENFPSWLYCVNLGATTIWERWNSVLSDGKISDTGMNSLNHYAYGSVMEFFYSYVGGIRPLEAGFKRALIAPIPDIRLKRVKCRYDSIQGTYACDWEIKKDGKMEVKVQVPFDCQADLYLPYATEKAEPIGLTCGTYTYSYMPLKDFRKPYNEETTLSRLMGDSSSARIIEKYLPVIGGILKSQDPEMGANSLKDLRNMQYLPFSPDHLEVAIKEIESVIVTYDC